MSFTIKRGTNISHWLSQSQRRGEERRNFFTRVDVLRLGEMGRDHGRGLDHLRLPIDEEQMWDEDLNPYAEAFDLLDAAIDWCAEAGLRVVVDLHLLRSHHFLDTEDPLLFADPSGETRFADLWRELSEHLDRWPTERVAYELLNEPVARDPEDWNRVAMSAYHAIREREPERVIVLGSNWFNQHQTFLKLRVPEDDDLILTFHYYLPMFVTHYTASWWATGGTYQGPIHYPGKPIARGDLRGMDEQLKRAIRENNWNRPFGPEAMIADLAQPLAVRERTGLPLYCGEFGCYDRTPDALRAAWYRDILSVFDTYGIAWANWDYKGSFGIVDGTGARTVVADALFG